MAAVIDQPFPASGELARNLNLSLKLVQTILKGQRGTVYTYIVDTVRCDGGTFVQTGSGPNFQGGLITLATCKHQMRSGIALHEWQNAWVAGLTGVEAILGHHVNYLFYLMRVSRAFSSHRDLWNALPEETRTAKAADLHRLGDLYTPSDTAPDPFDPEAYVEPRPDHAHCHEYGWHVDIDYTSVYGTRPPLLVGDPAYSFLWNRPLVAYPVEVHARTKKHDLPTLLGQLSNRPIREGR
jgi:hypothetical protein